jgi:hypothetical protein
MTTTATATTATTAALNDIIAAADGARAAAQALVEEAAYYGALYGLMLNMDSQPSPGAGSHNNKRTVVEPTAIQLLDGALGDTVDASTPHGEKKEDGVWRTVTRADCYDYDKTTALI